MKVEWTEIDGVWTHPVLGSIAPLSDGNWQITFASGERSEPLDSLENAMQSVEAIWRGWIKDGEQQWTHPRYGSIRKRKFGWYCTVKGESRWFSEKGPFQRSSFAIAEAARITPLASTIHTLQFADVFLWAVCIGASTLAIGNWLSAVACAIAGVAARMIFDARFDASANRVGRAFWECASFLFVWKIGQDARGHLALLGAHVDSVALSLGFVATLCVRIANALASATLRAAGPVHGVVWEPVPAELEPLESRSPSQVAVVEAEAPESFGLVPENPVQVRARALLQQLPEFTVHRLHAIRRSPNLGKLKETWIDSEEGLHIGVDSLRGLGWLPSLIVEDFETCGLIVRKYMSSDPSTFRSNLKWYLVMTPEVGAVLKGELGMLAA